MRNRRRARVSTRASGPRVIYWGNYRQGRRRGLTLRYTYVLQPWPWRQATGARVQQRLVLAMHPERTFAHYDRAW